MVGKNTEKTNYKKCKLGSLAADQQSVFQVFCNRWQQGSLGFCFLPWWQEKVIEFVFLTPKCKVQLKESNDKLRQSVIHKVKYSGLLGVMS